MRLHSMRDADRQESTQPRARKRGHFPFQQHEEECMPTQTTDTTGLISFGGDTWVIAPGVIASFNGAGSTAANSILVNYGSIITQVSGSVFFSLSGGGHLYNEESGLINGLSGVDILGGLGVSIRNQGEIFGTSTHGIHVGNAGNNVSITNTATGEIFGALAGVTISAGPAQNITIKNAGLIESEQHGIWLLNATGAAPVIINSGIISGEVNSILAADGDRLNIDNSGQLIGHVRGTSADLVDKVVNTGSIKGSVFLGSGADRYTGIAEIDDVLVSGKVSGTVFGQAGNDTLSGGNKVDRLDGGSGNDRLNGAGGRDTLNGGSGNDTLTGGTDKDAFVFDTALNASTNVDTITDFNVVADIMQIDNAVFAGLATGTLKAAAFRANTSGNAADSSDRVIYETDTGNLFFDANGSGAGGKVLFAKLDAGLALTNADFLVI
jgi:Ca2+-binding RTX toxin-like protein